MKLVLSTSPFDAGKLPGLLPELLHSGFDALEVKDVPEFWMDPDLWNALVLSVQHARIDVPNWHLATNSPFQETEAARKGTVNRVKQSMKKGCQLHSKNHVLHWLQRFLDPACHVMWQHAVDEWVEHASRLGIRLLLETVPDKPANERYVPVSEIVEFVKQYPAELVALCLDVNHSNVLEPLPDLVELMQERLVSVHISDNDGKSEKHWLPGQGVIDFPDLFRALRNIDFAGMIVFEAYKWCDDVHTPPRLKQLYRFGETLVRTGKPHSETPSTPYQKGKFSINTHP